MYTKLTIFKVCNLISMSVINLLLSVLSIPFIICSMVNNKTSLSIFTLSELFQ